MSEENVFPFPTSANQGPPMPDNTVPTPRPQPTPEEVQKMEEQGSPQVLQMIMRNRKIAHEHLQKAAEDLSGAIKAARTACGDQPLMRVENERGESFSLEDTLRVISRGLGACLTSMEANNSLMDMLIHDLGGMVYNMNQSQKAMIIANSHTQTLLELLKEKEIITEPEMEATWNKLVAEKQREAREKGLVKPTADSDQS